MNIKNWIEAFRLRTLPLSLSLIVVGSVLAYADGAFSWTIFGMAILTTLFLQILSNISNDYGDAVSGVDFAGRVGPQRAVQSGAISEREMKKAIYVFVILSLLSGLALLYVSYPRLRMEGFVMMFVIGLMSIAAAICYTVGKKPYGYIGLGDLFVFVFFGIVGVLGSNVLYVGEPRLSVLLPASSIGLLSVGVLNMNNMRDYESDKRSGKNTLVVRFGLEWGRVYQVVVVALAFVLLGMYIIMYGRMMQMIAMLALLRFVPHLAFVMDRRNTDKLDTQLKVVSLGTMLVAVLFAVGTILS